MYAGEIHYFENIVRREKIYEAVLLLKHLRKWLTFGRRSKLTSQSTGEYSSKLTLIS